jgi:hypothetical protein
MPIPNPNQLTNKMTLKQFLLKSILCISLLGCNNGSKPIDDKTDSAVKTETPVYPFTAKSSSNWRPGDEKNAVLVLNCLKKYVNGDIKGCCAYFANTAELLGIGFILKAGGTA